MARKRQTFFFFCEFGANIFSASCVEPKRALIPVKLVAAFASFVMQTQRFESFSVVLAIERSIIRTTSDRRNLLNSDDYGRPQRGVFWVDLAVLISANRDVI